MSRKIPLYIINAIVKDSALLNNSSFIIQFKEAVLKKNGQPDKRSIIQYAIMRKDKFTDINEAMVEKSKFTFSRVELEIFNWINHQTEESKFSDFVTVADIACINRVVIPHVGLLNEVDYETSVETLLFTYEIIGYTGYIRLKLHIGKNPKNVCYLSGNMFQPYLEKDKQHLNIREVKIAHGKISVFTNLWCYGLHI